MTQHQPTGPLVGVRVLEIGGNIAGPFATRLMAQYGAEVIKVERPGTGDPLRHTGPFVGNAPHPETSIPFLYLNTNKQSITLNLASARGRRILLDLAVQADVVVENLRPGTLAAWNLDWEALHAANPRLILTSISSFGQDGPYRDYEATEVVLAALGGIMYMSGLYDRQPLKHGHPQSQFIGGLHAAGASLVGYFQVLRGGEGQRIDLSLQAGVTSELVHDVVLYTYMGAVHGRAPREGGAGLNGAGNWFGGLVQTADGFVAADAPPPGRWDELADFLGIPELKDERFRSRTGRITHAREIDALVLPKLASLGRYEFFNHAQQSGWSAGVIQTMADVASCPQLAARGFWTEIDHPVAGRLRYPADFCRMSDSPGALITAAPLLGQDNERILGKQLGYSSGQLEALASQGVIS
ncbi:MAG: CoA transferase [Chloroflexi bacterium]|nr:CoA transferase [Chloroflexota bacterium]